MLHVTGCDEEFTFSVDALQHRAQEAIATARAFLPGAIIIKKEPKHEDPLRLALAVILPSAADARRDTVTIGRLSEGQPGGGQGQLSIANIKFTTLEKEYTLLVPHAVVPRPGGAGMGCSRIAIKSGTNAYVAVVVDNAEIDAGKIRMQIWGGDSIGNLETTVAGLLEILDVGRTGARNLFNNSFRMLHQNIRGHPELGGVKGDFSSVG